MRGVSLGCEVLKGELYGFLSMIGPMLAEANFTSTGLTEAAWILMSTSSSLVICGTGKVARL